MTNEINEWQCFKHLVVECEFVKKFLFYDWFHTAIRARSADKTVFLESQVNEWQAVNTWPAQYYIEVHAVDTNVGVVLNTQINMFLDAKAKIARRTEVAFSQLILSHL